MFLTKVVDIEEGIDVGLGPIIRARNEQEALEVANKNELVLIGEVPELYYKPVGVTLH